MVSSAARELGRAHIVYGNLTEGVSVADVHKGIRAFDGRGKLGFVSKRVECPWNVTKEDWG